MDLLFHRLVPSSGKLLRHYLTEGTLNVRCALDLLFLEEREQDFQRPDHAFKSLRELEYADIRTIGGLLRRSLERIADEYFEFRQTRLYVRNDRFAAWQRLISRVPPLPLITYALHREYGQGERASYELAKAQHILEPNLWPSTLPSAFCPAIEEMVETEGLSDLHVHLNGTTEADLVWLDALSKPQAVYRELKKGYNIPPSQCAQPVREQYDQIEPGLTPEKVYRRLTLARFLRYALTEYLFNNRASTLRHLNVQIDSKNAPARDDTLVRGMRHPVKALNQFGGLEEPLCEALFLWSAFQALSEEEADNEGGPLAPSLHLYLLIAGQFNRFIVQQTDQNGFDQFQKITVNEFRTHSEREYQRRFNQLARRDHNDLVFLEGRFAPGDGVSGNWERLSRILHGYALFQNAEAKAPSPHTLNIAGPHRMKLGLVAHFIKEADRYQRGRPVAGGAKWAVPAQ
jgi:hypothetical protein